jgi:hypothetical protein
MTHAPQPLAVAAGLSVAAGDVSGDNDPRPDGNEA